MNRESIKELRVRNNLTQDQLAQIMGKTTRTIQNWEKKNEDIYYLWINDVLKYKKEGNY